LARVEAASRFVIWIVVSDIARAPVSVRAAL
jgi:hypothetical protein